MNDVTFRKFVDNWKIVLILLELQDTKLLINCVSHNENIVMTFVIYELAIKFYVTDVWGAYILQAVAAETGYW